MNQKNADEVGKHHTKEAKDSPPYLHAGELLEFNVANEKAQCEKRKKPNQLAKLKKTAAEDENDHSLFQGIAGAGAAGLGTAAIRSGNQKLPFQTIYHGTSRENADKILQEGLRPDKGGTGIDQMTQAGVDFMDSKGTVHATADKNLAEYYGKSYDPEYMRASKAFTEQDLQKKQYKSRTDLTPEEREDYTRLLRETNDRVDDFTAAQKKIVNNPLDTQYGDVIQAKVPLTMIDRADFEADRYTPDGKLKNEIPEEWAQKLKLNAFRTTEHIPPEAIKGGQAGVLNKLKYRASVLPELAKAYPKQTFGGLGGIAAGAGLLASGAGLAGYGGYKALKGNEKTAAIPDSQSEQKAHESRMDDYWKEDARLKAKHNQLLKLRNQGITLEDYEKIAAEQEDDHSLAKGIGAVGAMGAGYKLFPMQTVYHGTSKGNADKILEEGLRPDKGGTGVDGTLAGDYAKQSKGYVHATTRPLLARRYAVQHYPEGKEIAERVKGLKNQLTDDVTGEVRDKLEKEIKGTEMEYAFRHQYDLFRKMDKNQVDVVKAKIPLTQIDRADYETLQYMDPSLPKANGLKTKLNAFRTTEQIPVEAIKGSVATPLDRLKYRAGVLPELAREMPGRTFGSLGLVGLGGLAGYQALQSGNETPSKTEEKHR